MFLVQALTTELEIRVLSKPIKVKLDLEILCRNIMLKEDEKLTNDAIDLKIALAEYFEPL